MKLEFGSPQFQTSGVQGSHFRYLKSGSRRIAVLTGLQNEFKSVMNSLVRPVSVPKGRAEDMAQCLRVFAALTEEQFPVATLGCFQESVTPSPGALTSSGLCGHLHLGTHIQSHKHTHTCTHTDTNENKCLKRTKEK